MVKAIRLYKILIQKLDILQNSEKYLFEGVIVYNFVNCLIMWLVLNVSIAFSMVSYSVRIVG